MEQLPLLVPDIDDAVQTYVPIQPVYCPDGFAQPIDNTPCPVCGANFPEEECKGLSSLLDSPPAK